MSGSTPDSGVAPVQPAEHRPGPWAPLLPVLVALVLCAPGFQFPFLFEDYDFLARARLPGWSKFLPDPGPIFYRPVSREAYYSIITALGGTPFVGHVLNFCLVAAGILLLHRVTSRLLGDGPALVSTLLFATFSQTPVLVSWVSGCQDLLAIDFILLALWLEVRGRHVWAMGAAALALLSKEIAIAAFPALAGAGWILGRGGRKSRLAAAGYVAVGVAWASIHPLTRLLLTRRFEGGETGYIGLDNPGRWVSLARSALTILNVPTSAPSTTWLPYLLVPAVLAAAVILLARRGLARPGSSPGAGFPGGARVALLGVCLGLPPLVLTSLLVRHWSPYYVALPAVGVFLCVATLYTRVPPGFLPTALAAYLVLGVVARAMPVSPEIPTEANLFAEGQALDSVERQFRALEPRLPRGAVILVDSFGSDRLSVRPHLCRFKAPRIWYDDPDMEVTLPGLRTDSSRPEFLFWVSRDLSVHEVNLVTLRPRSVQGQADYLEYQRLLRAYARGLADSGQLDRGVAVLLHMPEIRQEYRNLDHRLAAMLLLKYGRQEDASRLLASLPALTRNESVQVVSNTLQLRTSRAVPLGATMQAFGLSPGDPDALRAIMRTLRERGSYTLAAGVGTELLRLEPGDQEAIAAAADSLRGPWPDLLTTPAP